MSDTADRARPLYEVLADAFVAEGVDTQFVLTGDGNMHWSIALDQRPGVQSIHVRHEHCAVAAASAYAIASGNVGIASITCGPGLTQVITALPAAVRAQVPLVVFAGEPPLHATFYNQDIDQGPLVTATGARYIAAHTPQRMLDRVREAFHTARVDRCPVVLGVPYDLQKQPHPTDGPYVPSTEYLPDGGRTEPDPARVADIAARLAAAKAPVLVAGRGALRSGAADGMVALADAVGACLGTTLPVRGLFDGHRFSLGVVGGYSSDVTREVLADADLVLAVGASLSYYTKDNGRLFPNATVVQIDTAPRGLNHGMKAADLFLTCDARAGVAALSTALNGRAQTTAATIRTEALAERLASEAADARAFDIASGVMDPRTAIQALDAVVPNDWDIVTGSGHQAYFNAHMRGRPAERFTTIREFGAIGNGLSYAIGVAAARRIGQGNIEGNNADGRIVLIEGDGGVMMHIQELETIKRLGLRVLICVMNDGAYGSEIHKLRADGLDDQLAVFGRTSFEDIARGFGLRGANVTDPAQLPALFAAFDTQDQAEVWNLQISDVVTAPTMRKIIQRGHGVM